MADGSMKYHPVPVDEALFRQGLSLWASGVAIATCQQEGRPVGLTVSSFASVSVSPPRVLFCISKDSRSSRAFMLSDHVAINILSEADRDLAIAFAGGADPSDRFTDQGWRTAPGQPPRFDRALVQLSGLVRTRIDAGSHDILIVDVEQATSGEGAPLLYFSRTFQTLAAPAAVGG